MREFYRRRSAVHAGASQPGDWRDEFHVVIAAEVFSVAILRLLADANLRPLTDAEADRQDALDARIEALSATPKDVEEEWARCLEEARQRRVVAQVAQFISTQGNGAP